MKYPNLYIVSLINKLSEKNRQLEKAYFRGEIVIGGDEYINLTEQIKDLNEEIKKVLNHEQLRFKETE